MNNKSFQQALKPVFALLLALSLLLPANPTLALPQKEAPMLPTPYEPDDPEYKDAVPTTPPTDQWHYHGAYGINAPAAWGITTGSSSTVVAVLDTGIVSHDDLNDLTESRILAGYDFVGRDSDPGDAGDYTSCTDMAWEGTHVAGIIGAESNNAQGVAGIDWAARIVPVRVIGTCGSVALADLVDGMRWAAGLSVSGATTNYNPADVIQVSASIPGQLCTAYQDDIDEIIATGAVIVAAAGDTGTTGADAGNNFPGNCDSVITVTATDSEGVRAPYSNYGSVVEISAPGGGNGHGDVLSTVNSGVEFPLSGSGTSIYAGKHGTAMAAAHVSGVVSLMFAANRYITLDQVLEIFEITAADFSGTCTGCGWGIIDAGESVRIAGLPDLVITNVTLVPSQPRPNEAFDVEITVKNRGGSAAQSYVYRGVYINRDPRNLRVLPGGCLPTADPDDEPTETDYGDYYRKNLNTSIPSGGWETLPVTIQNPDTLEPGLPSGNYEIYTYTDANCNVNESFEDNNHFPKAVVSIGDIPNTFTKTAPANDESTLLPSSVTLDWNETLGVDSYEYCLDTFNDQVCQDDDWITTNTDTSVNLTGLAGSTVYYWQARAKNYNGYRYADDTDPDDGIVDGWWAFKTMPFPTLISPANRALVTTMTPTLLLRSMDGASEYEFQVSENSDFSTTLVNKTGVLTPSYLLSAAQALPYGTYYWRARSKYPDATFSDWSSGNQFGVTFQLKPAQYSYSTIVKPTFTWKAITNARQYNLQVSRTSDFAVLEIDRTQNTGTSYVSPAAMDYGVHYWRIRVCTGTSLATCTWSKFAIGSKFTLTPALSGKPTLVSPITKAMLTSYSMTLTWKKVTGDDRYEVQVDNNSNFASPEETFITPTGVVTHHITAPLVEGVYYWRVRTSNYLSIPGLWSLSRSFTLDNTAPTLSPVLAMPLNNAPVVGTPSFSWNSVTGAAKYQFQYDDSTDFLAPVIYTSPAQTSLKHTPPTMPLGTYYWRARVQDTAGNPGPWSAYRTVIINPPKPAVPVLIAPASALSTNVTTPVFTWNPVAYAATYNFQLSTSSSFPSPQTHSVPSPTYTSVDILTDGTYYWRVQAVNSAAIPGTWSSNTRSFKVDTVSPDAPALDRPANNASVSTTPAFLWKASTTGATKYQFQYATDVDFTTGVYTSAVLTTLGHTPKPAMIPRTYYWRVKGWDLAGNESAWSEVRTVTILAAPTLSSPGNGHVTNDATPDFSWNAAVSGSTYEIEIATDSKFLNIVQTFIGAAGVRTYTANPALPGSGLYYWHVRARNTSNMPGLWSSYRSFTVDITPPLAPVLSSPLNNADVLGNPIFKWTAAATATKYLLQYDADGDFNTGAVTSAELPTTSYSPPPLAVGDYYWRVKARDALGNWGEYSGAFRVNVLPDVPPPPVLVSPANALVTNDSTPTFTWNAVASGNTYDIEIATDAAFTSIIPTLPTPTGLGVTYTPTTVLSDGLYYWHVRAWNVTPASGLWSAARSFTVDTTGPAAPVLSLPADTTTVIGTPAFKWLASVTATKYRFQYDDVSAFGSPNYTSGELTTTSHTPPTMAPGTYYWHVQARDAAGNWGSYNVTPFAVTINPPTPAAPVLTAPANSMATNVNTTPVFTWNAVAYAVTYNFQLSTSSTFASPQTHSVSSPTYTSADILIDGTYYWRVQAVNSALVPGSWSARSFKVDTQAPAAPILNLPAIVASVNGTPTFSWKSSTGATKYQFQYDDDFAFGSPYTSSVLTTTSVKPPTLSVGTYYWRVIAGDAANNWSSWNSGEVRAVTVTPLAPTGIPTLVGPVNGSIVLTTMPTVSWKAVTGAVKYRVQMDGNSTFSSPEFDQMTSSLQISPVYPLSNGVYYWRVCKVDQYGGQGVWSAVRRLSVNEVIPLAVTVSSLSELSALSDEFYTSTPTLSWNSVAYGDTYQLQVDDNSDFNTPSFDDTADTTSRTVSTPLSNGEYFWRVRAINEYGTPGPWSETWTINIDVPPAP